MGLFNRSKSVTPVQTPLDSAWFGAWVNRILDARGEPNTPDSVFELLVKASTVIDHDCRDYVARYCDAQTLPQYVEYFEREGSGLPWGLVSFAAGCNSKPGWTDFIVDDVSQKLERFAQIVIDPTSIER